MNIVNRKNLNISLLLLFLALGFNNVSAMEDEALYRTLAN